MSSSLYLIKIPQMRGSFSFMLTKAYYNYIILISYIITQEITLYPILEFRSLPRNKSAQVYKLLILVFFSLHKTILHAKFLGSRSSKKCPIFFRVRNIGYFRLNQNHEIWYEERPYITYKEKNPKTINFYLYVDLLRDFQ